jgi:hypothetical protein
MIFSRQNKQTPDVRTKIGKVLAVESGLLDIATVGGSAVFRRVRCSGPLPNAGDKVMVSFYKNNEIVATPISSRDSDTVSQNANVSGGGGINIYQGTGYTIGDGLDLSGGNVLSAVTTLNRTQITSGKVDVDTGLLPSPLIGDAGKSLIANGANSSSWGWPVNGSYGHLAVFGSDTHSIVDSSWLVDGSTLYATNSEVNYFTVTNAAGNCELNIGASGGAGNGTIRIQASGTGALSQVQINLEDGSSSPFIHFKSTTGLEFMAINGYMSTWTGPKMTLDGDDEQSLTLSYNKAPKLALYVDPGGMKVMSFDTLNFTEMDGSTWQSIETGAIAANGALTLKNGAITASLQLGASGTPVLTLPIVTGTLALTSDIPAGLTGSGSSGNIVKWTGTSAVGNSIISESGAAISVAGALTLVGQSNTNHLIIKSYSTQTSAQMLFQSSAAAELARFYVNATYSIVLGYQAGASLGASTGSVLIGYQAGNALTTNDIVAIGYQAGKSATGGRNVFIGKNAGRLTVGGDYNVAIGEGALETNVSGQSSFALGYGALGQATASENTAVGVSSLQKCTTGYYNVAIGTLALGELLGATGNIGVGQSALRNLVSGTDNTAIGTSSGYSATGSNNIFLGHTAGGSCTGSNNVIIGYHAGRYTGTVSAFGECVYVGTLAGGGTGNYCVGVGRETLTANVTAATAVGYQAGKVATGAGNVFFGYQAGVAVSSGANNTILGYQAGASLSTNGGSVMIGYQAGNAETAANKLYIANSSTTTPLIYGDFSTPSLTFNGTVNIAEGKNIVLGTTTGSKLGATTSDKLGVWGATPIVQPTTGVAAATFTANSGTAVNDASTFDGYTLKQVVKALRNTGLLA